MKGDTINVAICGVAGRMGRANIEVFSEDKDIKIVGAIEEKGSRYSGQDAGTLAGLNKLGVLVTNNLEEIIEHTHVIVDFTKPDATMEFLECAYKHRKSMVIGTTGLSKDQVSKIEEYSRKIAILFSPNMSQGINILFYLVKRAAELFDHSFDVEIVEMHHKFKKDAPSATALRFGNIIAGARGKNLEDVGVFTRHGLPGERKKGEIGIMALRLSDVIGEHTIIFGGSGERIEFSHRCNSRKNFASGALRAAKFVVNRDCGFFTIEDVLNIR